MKRNQKPARSTSTPTTSTLQETPAIPGASITPLSWFTQATIILALIPFVGYLLSLSYELAYFDYFHIPYYYVSLSPTTVLATMVSTSLPFSPILLLVSFAIALVYLLIDYIAKSRKRFLFALLILVVFLYFLI